MMGRILGSQLSIILLFSLVSYVTIVALSILFFNLHHPDLINYIKQSIIMAFSHQVLAIGIWLVLAILYWYVKCGGYDIEYAAIKHEHTQTKHTNGYIRQCVWVLWKERMLTTSILITLVFLHATIAINNANSQLSQLCYLFKTGKSQHPNHADTNYDRSWPGWAYYYGDSYYTQTKERLQKTRGKLMDLRQFDQMLLALKDVNDGIYSIRSWLTNHRLFYDLLRITCGLVGTMVVGALWMAWGCGRICGKGWAYKGIKVCILGLFWLLMPVLGVFGQLAHSLVLMNENPVCLAKPSSGVVVITINSKSVNRISQLKLTLVEDPNSIYNNVCYNMQKYYQTPVQSDKFVIKHVINISLVGFVWVFVFEILWIIYSQRISNYKLSPNADQLGYNTINENQ